MRAAVMHEIRRSYEALCTQDAGTMLDTLIGVVDSVVGHEVEGMLAFHVMLCQRLASASSENTPASIDCTAINDRAALLQVRLALEHNDTQPAAARPNGRDERPIKRRSASNGVRWSLANGGEHGEHEENSPSRRSRSVLGAGGNAPPSGSRLCMHALEALRGSVRAIESEQHPPDEVAHGGEAISARASSSDGGHAHVRRRTSSSLASDDAASSLASSVESTTRAAWGLESKAESKTGSPPTERPPVVSTRSPTHDAEQQPSSARASTRTPLKRWDLARSVFLGKPTAAADPSAAPIAKRESATRGATLRRMMAAEPGAEDRDLRQMQMLRQRSGSCLAMRRLSCSNRRVTPASPPVEQTTTIAEEDSRASPESSLRGSAEASVHGTRARVELPSPRGTALRRVASPPSGGRCRGR